MPGDSQPTRTMYNQKSSPYNQKQNVNQYNPAVKARQGAKVRSTREKNEKRKRKYYNYILSCF